VWWWWLVVVSQLIMMGDQDAGFSGEDAVGFEVLDGA